MATPSAPSGPVEPTAPAVADADVQPQSEPESEHWWTRIDRHLHRNKVMSLTTKIVVTLVGLAVLTAGLIMMVTPGPGLVGIAVGLAILATEYDWADRWLQAARRKIAEAKEAALEMDPAVRKRRLILTTTASVLVGGGVLIYLLVAGWPGWSVDVWDKAQSFIGFLPDLPGMP